MQSRCFERLAELYKGQKEYQEQYQRLSKEIKATLNANLDLAALMRADERVMHMLGMPGDQARAGAGAPGAAGSAPSRTTHTNR